MTNSGKNVVQGKNGFRTAARIISVPIGILFLFLTFPNIISDDPAVVDAGQSMISFFVLVGVITAWWAEKVGGILLIITSIGMGIYLCLTATGAFGFPLSFFGRL